MDRQLLQHFSTDEVMKEMKALTNISSNKTWLFSIDDRLEGFFGLQWQKITANFFKISINYFEKSASYAHLNFGQPG